MSMSCSMISTVIAGSRRPSSLAVAADGAGDQIEERRLAGAVGSDQSAALARAHGELHGVHGAEPAEGLGDALEAEGERLAQARLTGSTGTGGSRGRRAGASCTRRACTSRTG